MPWRPGVAVIGGTATHPSPLRGINLELDGSDKARLRPERVMIISLD
jgi:hypothetical protein